jgi:hypothetical protein
MNTIGDFLFPLIPALIVFATAYLFFTRMRNDQRSFQQLLLRLEERKHSLPLQLKAYERLIIMLERITPSAMVMRLNQPGISLGQLHLELLKAVREEFELNVSMQMYVGRTAWDLTVQAREETTQLIKTAAMHAGAQGTAIDLSKAIFELEQQTGNAAIKQALNVLRAEAGKML